MTLFDRGKFHLDDRVKKFLPAFTGGGRDAVAVRHLLTLTRAEAARKYRLNPHRIGDVWVTAAKDVVFGHSAKERETLPKGYRAHGSAHELDIPCVIYRYAGKLPGPADLRTNVDVCKFLYQG